MKLSIIIAAYNIDQYIEKCMDSILAQTNNNYEVIIVNDGSTDSTEEKIKNYEKKFRSFRLVTQENKGLIEARKTGLKYASGEYIYFLDGDDWLEKCMVHTVSQYFDRHNDIILINSKKVYEDGATEFYPLYKKNSTFNLESVLTEKVMPAIWGKIIKKDFIDRNNITFIDDVTFAEDLAITTALFINEPKVTSIDKPLHNYFVRKTSVTNTVNERIFDIILVLEYIEKMVTERFQDKYKEHIENLYIEKLIGYAYVYSVRNKKIREVILKRYKEYKIDYTNKNKFKARVILAMILQKSNGESEEIIANILIFKNNISKRMQKS